MKDHERRLRRLEQTANAQDAHDPDEDVRIVFARKWIGDHDVDPDPLDRWVRHDPLVVDLYTYTVLMEAEFEVWEAFGEHLPVYSSTLGCVAVIGSVSQRERDCTCTDRSCDVCQVALYIEWRERMCAQHPSFPPVVLLSDIRGLAPLQRSSRRGLV